MISHTSLNFLALFEISDSLKKWTWHSQMVIHGWSRIVAPFSWGMPFPKVHLKFPPSPFALHVGCFTHLCHLPDLCRVCNYCFKGREVEGMSGYFVNKLDLDSTAYTRETSQCAKFHQPLAFGGHGTCYHHTLLSGYYCLKMLPGSRRKLFRAETRPPTLFSS